MLFVKIVVWVFTFLVALVAFGNITFTITDWDNEKTVWDSRDHIWLRLLSVTYLSLFVANLFGWIG